MVFVVVDTDAAIATIPMANVKFGSSAVIVEASTARSEAPEAAWTVDESLMNALVAVVVVLVAEIPPPLTASKPEAATEAANAVAEIVVDSSASRLTDPVRAFTLAF